MKLLPIDNRHYMHLFNGFRQWLSILGYAQVTIYNCPHYVKELLFHLEQQDIQHIRFVEFKHIEGHIEMLKTRRNTRRGGTLSNVHINSHIQAIKLFAQYLWNSKKIHLPIGELQHLKIQKTKREILTVDEVKSLFEATDKRSFYGIRDRAMLALYYGAGLRRSEATALNEEHIISKRNLIYVQKGKGKSGFKEGYVPVTHKNLQYIEDYIKYSRPYLLGDNKLEEALLIGQRKTRINSQSLLLRLKLLVNKVGITKNVGLHSLRHAIATHLLQGGMSLEGISAFLRHSSLESTQIYTHTLNELENEAI